MGSWPSRCGMLGVGVVRPHHAFDVEVQVTGLFLILRDILELEVEGAPVLVGVELELADRTLFDGVGTRPPCRVNRRRRRSEAAELDGALRSSLGVTSPSSGRPPRWEGRQEASTSTNV